MITKDELLLMGPNERRARVEGFSDEAVAVCTQLDRLEARLDALAERFGTALARVRASMP
jgi:ubiquinone biosynthesis protein UbiJ